MAPLAVLVWIPTVLVLDRFAGVGQQALLGAGTWVLLLALLRREDGLTRAQVAVVVGYATLVEYTFSAVLGVYVYRLGGAAGVPAFVPPGHGLVYLAALCLGRSARFRARPHLTVALAAAGVTGYAVWGLVASPRLDVLGAFLGGMPAAVPVARARAPGVRGCIRRRHLPRNLGDVAGHVDVAGARPDGGRRDREPAQRRRRGLRVLRRGSAAAGTASAPDGRPVAVVACAAARSAGSAAAPAPGGPAPLPEAGLP